MTQDPQRGARIKDPGPAVYYSAFVYFFAFSAAICAAVQGGTTPTMRA